MLFSETHEVVELAENLFRKLCLDVANLMSSVHGSYLLRIALQVRLSFLLKELSPLFINKIPYFIRLIISQPALQENHFEQGLAKLQLNKLQNIACLPSAV